jgi:hypothetical protein
MSTIEAPAISTQKSAPKRRAQRQMQARYPYSMNFGITAAMFEAMQGLCSLPTPFDQSEIGRHSLHAYGFLPSCSKSPIVTAIFNASVLCGYRPISADTVLYWYAVTAVAALFVYSPITAHTPAAFAIGRSICRKNKRPPVASASLPQNSASNSAAGQIFANHCQRNPSGNTKSATNAYAIKSKPSKHTPSKHASASRSIFVPSLITSDDSAF